MIRITCSEAAKAARMSACLLLAAAAGCGVSAGPTSPSNLVPVTGVVTYKGRSLTGGTITFGPIDAGREAHGAIGPDGSFALSTFREADGVIAGPHRIAVSQTGKGSREAVPPRFKNLSSSGVEVEVTSGRTVYEIDLK